MAIGRLAWASLAPHTKRKLDEKKYRLNLGRNLISPKVQEQRLRALAIRSRIEQNLKKSKLKARV